MLRFKLSVFFVSDVARRRMEMSWKYRPRRTLPTHECHLVECIISGLILICMVRIDLC